LRATLKQKEAAGASELDLKKHQELIDETLSVIPGAKSRL